MWRTGHALEHKQKEHQALLLALRRNRLLTPISDNGRGPDPNESVRKGEARRRSCESGCGEKSVVRDKRVAMARFVNCPRTTLAATPAAGGRAEAESSGLLLHDNVEGLDLSASEAADYADGGRPAYPPQTLLKL